MSEVLRRYQLAFAIGALAIVALFVRINLLTAWPLSLDESYSAFGAAKGFSFIWHILPGYETHPPFYTALLRCWTLLAGDTIYPLRLLGVAIGLSTLPAIWFAARELALAAGRNSRTVPLCALAFATVLPAHVEIARFVRPYYFMILVYSIAIWALIRLARRYRQEQALDRAAWIAYLCCLPLMIWLHNLGSFFVFALVLALFVLVGPVALLSRHLRAFAIGHGLSFLAALPALLILADQAPTWTHSTWLAFVPSSLPVHLMLIYGAVTPPAAFAGLVLAGFGLRATGRNAWRTGIALVLLAIVPVLMSIVVSLTIAPVFLVRTLVSCSVPLLLLIALGADEGLWQRAGLALLCVFTAIRLVQVQHMEPDQDWYGAARWIARHVGPGDLVYAYPNEGALPMRNALRDIGKSVPIRAIPSEIPARDPAGWYPTGSRGVQSLTPERLAQIADDPFSRATPTIWLFRLGKRPYDLGDESVKALARKRTPVAHFEYKAIDIIGFARSAETPPPQQAKP